MNCPKCDSEEVVILTESWSGYGISTIRTNIRCKICSYEERIKETDAINEKLIWFRKEKK